MDRTQAQKVALAGLGALAIIVSLNYGFFEARVRYYLDRNTNTDSVDAGQRDPFLVDAAPEGPVRVYESNRILIPKIGVDAPIVYIRESNEAAFQKALENGVVHFPGTAKPGQPGNVYIFGHSSDYAWRAGDFKYVFANLPNLKVGDEVTVTDGEGTPFRYRIRETKVVLPKDLSVLDQGDGSESLLTVQTSYPIGTALRRFLVIGELVQE